MFSLHATLLGLSAATASGMRVTVPAVCLAYAHQLGLLQLSDECAWLSTPAATVLMTALLSLELLADKIPALDHVMHLVATPFHAAAGALVVAAPAGSFSAGSVGDATSSESVAVAAGFGALAALAIHAAKAAARTVATATCCGSANCCLSFLEDVFVFLIMALAILFTVAAAMLAIACVCAVASALGYLLCGHADRHQRTHTAGVAVHAGDAGRPSIVKSAPVLV